MVEFTLDKKMEFVSYNQYQIMLDNLIYQLEPVRHTFHYICGFPRGGLPLAVHLSHHLDLRYLGSENLNKKQIEGKNILIVDDIIDSGLTVQKATKGNMFGLKIASLFYKEQSFIRPDYFCLTANEKIWIVFPWEKENVLIKDQVFVDMSKLKEGLLK